MRNLFRHHNFGEAKTSFVRSTNITATQHHLRYAQTSFSGKAASIPHFSFLFPHSNNAKPCFATTTPLSTLQTQHSLKCAQSAPPLIQHSAFRILH